jgi:hypothetical protein
VTAVRSPRTIAASKVRNADPRSRNATFTGSNRPAHARTRSGGHAPLIQSPRSAGRDHGLIPFARSRIGDAGPVRLNALTQTSQGSGLQFRLGLTALAFCTALLLLVVPASAQAAFGISSFDASILTEGGIPATQAGSHPVSLNLDVQLKQSGPLSDADLRDLSLELPPGLLENPTALPFCTQAAFATPRSSPWEEPSLSGESCPDRTQIGIVTLASSYAGGETRSFGLFNLAAPPGRPSEFGFNAYGIPFIFVPQIRQGEGDYGVTLEAHDLSQVLGISDLDLTIWGTPWSILHDTQRGNCLNEEEPSFGWAKCSTGRPAKNPPLAYLTLPTSCEGSLAFSATATSWQEPVLVRSSAFLSPLSACGSLDFAPEAHAALINARASSPSGYQFKIEVDTTGVRTPALRAPAPVRKATVSLPEGVTINPSVGAGLGVCTPSQYAAETPISPPGAGCPSESKIGDFSVRSPLVAGPLSGSIFLAAPYQNPSGGLLAVYLVAKNPDRGFLVKLPGALAADPSTGRLTATFDRLPQLPYSELTIDFREGQRSPLATPAACGAYSTEADLIPWRNPVEVRHASLPLQIAAGIGGGPCPSGTPGFTPKVGGGSLNSQAGAYSPFFLHLTRTDTEQEITSYSATFPPGLLGRLAGVPYCSDAAIAAATSRTGVEERDHPSCPEASRIGRTTSGYGLGSVLTYAPGGLYLAGPYHGAQVSVVAIDSALVGPFDLGVIVIRSAIRIDTTSAQASIDATGTDPIPHIVKGIPIHLRDIRAYIDRPGFTVNPTSCQSETIASALNGSGALFGEPSDDTLATATGPYQAFNCSSLGFRPAISIRAKGAVKRARRPLLRVSVTPRRGDANIGSAQVSLPPSIFLNQAHIRAICTRPKLAADQCPPDSSYGEAKAFTPLLDQPLTGKAYLVSSTNELPDLVFALRGEGFAVNITGAIDSAPDGGLRGTFSTLPDAPVTKFLATFFGAKRGILENSANLCTAPPRGRARLLAHSNRGWISRPHLQASCRRGGRSKHSDQKGHKR